MKSFSVWIPRPPNYAHGMCLWEIAESLSYALRGVSRLPVPVVEGFAPLAADHIIVVGPHLLPAGTSLPKGTILYNLEQYSAPVLSEGKLLDLFRRHEVWDYSQKNVDWLKERDIQAKHLPIGYVPELTRIMPAVEQDIDVLFYGSMNERRESILMQLEMRGAKIYTVFGVYGAERDALIARAKIVLNVHFYQPAVFEIVRCSYLFANRVCVVSESGGTDPELEKVALRCAVCVPYEKLVDKTLEILKADREVHGGALARSYGHLAFERFSEMPLIPRLAEVLNG